MKFVHICVGKLKGTWSADDLRDFSSTNSIIDKSVAVILMFALILPLSCSFVGRPNRLIEAAYCTRTEGFVTNLTLEWNRTYGGVDDDEPWAIIQAADGGYALAGSTYSFGAGSGDVWLVRTDDSGNVLWNKTYGGASTDVVYSIVQTNDGGYALAGTTYSFGNGLSDFWLLKTDYSGTVLWSKTYGGAGNDIAMSVVQTVDGDYALVGCTQSFGAGSWDAWLIKTDGSGNMLLNQTFGGTDNDGARSLLQTNDGGFAMTGSTVSFSVGLSDFWLIKTDSNGTMKWSKTYGGANWDDPYAVVQTSDGGYVLAGCSQSFGSGAGDFWLIRTDASGNHVWNRTYGGTSEDRPYSLTQTFDGGYALVGYTYSFGAGDSDIWFMKTSADGNVQWNQTYGGTSEDYARSMVQTRDGGYALAGTTHSFGAGGTDFWMVKASRESSTIVVPDDCSTIQEAIDNAADGDTVFVKAGTYYEHVVVGKTVSLVGQDRSTTIVDGGGTGCVLLITYDNVSVTGFTVQGGQLGIYVLNSRWTTIFDNTITHIYGSDWDAGIRLEHADCTAIRYNEITDNWRGILLYTFSPYANICGNNVTSNEYGIRVAMGGSSFANISDNYVAHNRGYGIDVTGFGGEGQSNNATIARNLIVNNLYEAIGLGEGSNYNTVVQNSMIGNGHAGMTLERYSNYNTAVENNIIDNAYGICFDLFTINSTQNTIFHNNLINNTQQVRIAPGSINAWNSSYPSGGNYWSDYSGLDQFSGPYQDMPCMDGIGDTPYVIDANNIDNYPLMIPWTHLEGDVDHNGTVDLFDAQLLAKAFGSTPASGNWNANADLNSDMSIDIFDAIILSSNFGKRT